MTSLLAPIEGTPYVGGAANSFITVDLNGLQVTLTGIDGELVTWSAAGVPETVAAGSSGDVLTSNGAGSAPTFQAAGGGGSPGGADTNIQFNDSGAFGGSGNLTWDDSTLAVTAGASSPGFELTLNATPGNAIVARDSGLSEFYRVNSTGGIRITGSNVNDFIEMGGTSNQIFNFSTNLGGRSFQIVGDTSGVSGPAHVRFGSLGMIHFNSATGLQSGSRDTGIGRSEAGVVEVNDTVLGQLATLQALAVKLGDTAAHATTAGTNIVSIFNGTAPVGTLTNGASLYTAAGEMNVIDSGGVVTLLSPHDDETGEWIFRSTNTVTGRTIKFRMEELMKRLAKMVGPELFQETFEDV